MGDRKRIRNARQFGELSLAGGGCGFAKFELKVTVTVMVRGNRFVGIARACDGPIEEQS